MPEDGRGINRFSGPMRITIGSAARRSSLPGPFSAACVYIIAASYGIIASMDSKKERTSLILHGHFYQPPRENPFTGVIPKQPSASPYEDWNERIFHDCYNANAHSRYLSSDRRVISITNNFSYISYNFGPTLLSWIHEEHPEVEDLLKEADRASIGRLGHGNAMAQSFNHTILPLDRPVDARLQIEWGARYFESRFGRKAEGMWLPEAGVNGAVIDMLAEEGIRFIVLSPWQCRAVEGDDGKMAELSGKPAPYWEPFILTGDRGGTISAFFYHPGLAEGISFGHMLQSADNLYQTLKSIRESEGKPLIHTATDGEIYGHHEPYGDMALAALIRKVSERDDFMFDNYASYLERHPASRHAVLHAGEDGRGTSWSCSHGVSRWYKDCGCTTGGEPGWNQAWRAPLRNGLRNLADKLDSIFQSELEKIFHGRMDAHAILSKAAGCICGDESMRAFLERLHGECSFDPSYDVELASLISGMKNKHFSFTSCGFFFADISGIEPRQNIKYALYAIKMFQPYFQGDLLYPFLADLRAARSNIKAQGDGMSIAQEESKGLPGEAEAALYFFLNRVFAPEQCRREVYGRFVLLHLQIDDAGSFSADIADTVAMEVSRFTVLSSSSIDNGINLYICQNDRKDNPINRIRVTNQDIPLRMMDDLYRWIDISMSSMTFSELSDLARDMRHFSMLVKNSKYVPLETNIMENLGLTLKIIKSLFTVYVTIPPAEKKEILGNMIDFVKKSGRNTDIGSINTIFSQNAAYLASKIRENGFKMKEAEEIDETLSMAYSHGFRPEIGALQDAVYPYYSGAKASDVPDDLARKTYLALNFE